MLNVLLTYRIEDTFPLLYTTVPYAELLHEAHSKIQLDFSDLEYLRMCIPFFRVKKASET